MSETKGPPGRGQPVDSCSASHSPQCCALGDGRSSLHAALRRAAPPKNQPEPAGLWLRSDRKVSNCCEARIGTEDTHHDQRDFKSSLTALPEIVTGHKACCFADRRLLEHREYDSYETTGDANLTLRCRSSVNRIPIRTSQSQSVKRKDLSPEPVSYLS